MPGFQLLSGTTADSIDARHADWDRAALYDWLHHIMDRPGVPGVNGWGIEHGYGRLDLIDAESVPALVTYLERLRVPCGLVKFGVYGPFHVT